jgi:hypothetical protein
MRSRRDFRYPANPIAANPISAANRISFVSGLAEGGVTAVYSLGDVRSATSGHASIGLALDSTSVFDNRATNINNGTTR